MPTFTAAIFSLLVQVSVQSCVCDLKVLGKTFPEKQLQDVKSSAAICNQIITSQQILETDILLDKLHYRLQTLTNDVSALEHEDDGQLFGAVSLRIIEIELAEILDLITELNNTHHVQHSLTKQISKQMENVRNSMEALEQSDQAVVQKLQENRRLKRNLTMCENKLLATVAPPMTAAPGNCPLGQLTKVTGPSTYITTQYGTSYPYGAWGRDAIPAVGKEDWYWLVALTSSNVYGNYIRQYSSLSALTLGVSAGDVSIASSNPTTNTIQGPNAVLYGDALYYGCYNSPSLCRFNMTSRVVTTVALPSAGHNNKFPFCHLDACYSYTDVDLATDEWGVWAAYATVQNYGNLVLSQVQPGNTPVLGRTWNTTLHKRTASNTFVACGVLYATRYVDKENEEIFYAFDTVTGQERFDLKLRLRKMASNIQSLNYNPRDRTLYVYSDAYVMSYPLTFE